MSKSQLQVLLERIYGDDRLGPFLDEEDGFENSCLVLILPNKTIQDLGEFFAQVLSHLQEHGDNTMTLQEEINSMRISENSGDLTLYFTICKYKYSDED